MNLHACSDSPNLSAVESLKIANSRSKSGSNYWSLIWPLLAPTICSFWANFARKNFMNNAYNYIYLKANSDEYSHASFAKQCLQLYLHLKANSYRSVHTLKKSSENHSDPKNNCCWPIWENPKSKSEKVWMYYMPQEVSLYIKIISYFKKVGRTKFRSFVFFSKMTFLSRSKFTSFCLSKNR